MNIWDLLFELFKYSSTHLMCATITTRLQGMKEFDPTIDICAKLHWQFMCLKLKLQKKVSVLKFVLHKIVVVNNVRGKISCMARTRCPHCGNWGMDLIVQLFYKCSPCPLDLAIWCQHHLAALPKPWPLNLGNPSPSIVWYQTTQKLRKFHRMWMYICNSLPWIKITSTSMRPLAHPQLQ